MTADILNLPMPNLQFTPVASSKMTTCWLIFACFMLIYIYFWVCLFILSVCLVNAYLMHSKRNFESVTGYFQNMDCL